MSMTCSALRPRLSDDLLALGAVVGRLTGPGRYIDRNLQSDQQPGDSPLEPCRSRTHQCIQPAANEQQGSVHISVSIGKCGGINMKVAIGAAGVGLLGLIAMSDKKGKGGRGVGGHRSRLAMHNRL